MIFWDTSALVKAYFEPEPGHARARNLLLGSEPQCASTLILPEAAGAITRRAGRNIRLRDAVLNLLEEHLEGMNLTPMSEPDIGLSLKLIRRHSLRGADAVHLAAALLLSKERGNRKFRFITADAEQAAAARAEGLRVLEPS